MRFLVVRRTAATVTGTDRRWLRRSLELLLAIVTAGIAGVALTLPAAAHNALIGSSPADGSTVPTPPTSVTLTFDQPVINYQPLVTVTGPNGNSFSVGDPVVSGSTVSIGVSAGPAGRYTAAYRVGSADGHPVYGEIGYTVAAGGTATGSPPTAGAATAAPHDRVPASPGLGGWLWAGIAVAVLLVAAAVAVVLRPSGKPDKVEDGDR